METNNSEGHAFRLNFKCTNNMAEYEALILGLQIIINSRGKRILIMGDSDLIIKQVNGVYSIYNPRPSRYRDTVIDLTDDLLECKLVAIPRKQNIQAHCLETFTSTCNLPFQPNLKYTTKVKHRPIIPDNLKYRQFFLRMNRFTSL